MNLTARQLQVSTGSTAERAAFWLSHMRRAGAIFAIDTPARMAAFLAQVGHESGRLVYVRELWGPTPAQRRYEGRADLGNVQAGDGKRFMGRGLIQTTGRANYCATRDGLRQFLQVVPDFEMLPDQLEQPDMAAMSAAWYWHSRGLNALADAGNFERITRKVNGGLNGYAERQALHSAALVALA